MNKTKKLVFSGLFAALICIATIIIKIQTPGGGYFNLGDCMVITSGVVLGPYSAFFASAIGSALADVISGYAIYVPATFIIKGAMALIVGFIYLKYKKLYMSLISAFIAELIMVIGYMLYEFILTKNFSVAVLGMPGNALQGIVGIASSMALITLITKNKAINKFITH